MHDYEEAPSFFCHIDDSKRPRCGSIAMKESWSTNNHRKYKDRDVGGMSQEEIKDMCNLKDRSFGRYWDLWDEWANPRQVESYGKCDKHIPRK
jgi:hypothetical protein